MPQPRTRKPRSIQKRKKPLPSHLAPGPKYRRDMSTKPPRGVKHVRGGAKPSEYERYVPRTHDVLRGREQLRGRKWTDYKKDKTRAGVAERYGKKYGPDAKGAILMWGPDAANAIRKLRAPADKKAAAKLMHELGGHATTAILKYGKPALDLIYAHGNGAAIAIAGHGPEAMETLRAMPPVFAKKACSAITQYGEPMYQAVKARGSTAVVAVERAQRKGMTFRQIKAALEKDPKAFVASIMP